jgi:hypothetical protein
MSFSAKLRCVKAGNAVKVYVDYQGMENRIISKKIPWKSPFIDLFFYKILQYKNNQTVLREVSPSGQHRKNAFNVGDYFPTQPLYFAGLYVMGADPYVARKRYKWNTCLLPKWNHRLEKSFSTSRKEFGTRLLSTGSSLSIYIPSMVPCVLAMAQASLFYHH